MRPKNIFFFLIFFFSVFLSNAVFAQLSKDVVAKIGGKEITAGEFVVWYEMTPKYIAHVKWAQDALKEELIYTMAADKLFALEAERLHLDTIPEVRKRIFQFEKMFAADALFKTEITEKIDQSQQTLSNEFAKALTKIDIKAIRNSNEAQIKNNYDFLQKGLPFDSLFLSIYGENAHQNELTVSYGMFDVDVENLLYETKPKEYTAPIEHDGVWYIFYIESKHDTTMKSSQDFENEFARVKKIYLERMTQKYYKAFKTEFFKGLKVSTDGRLLSLLLGKLREILTTGAQEDKNFASAISHGEEYSLKSDYFYKLPKNIPQDSLSAPYFVHEGVNYPLDDFIYFLAGEGRTVSSIDKEYLTVKLKNWTRDFIESELLAKEAMKRQLHKKPDVRREFNIWRDFTLSNAYQSLYVDSAKISDAEVMDYFIRRNEGHAGGVSIKLIRAVTGDLDLISSVLERAERGEDFRKIASDVNGDRDAEINGKADQFIPAADYGETGSVALKLTPGRVYGPIKVGDEYVVVKLVDKKNEDIVMNEEYEAVKEKLRRDLAWQKYYKSIVDNTAELAVKYNTQIDLAKIKELKVTETNAIYYRYMGFGGRITAFPLSKPFTEWVEEWQKMKSLNP